MNSSFCSGIQVAPCRGCEIQDGGGLEDEGGEEGRGQLVGHPTSQAQGLGLLPGGNGGTMKDEKERITGVQGM